MLPFWPPAQNKRAGSVRAKVAGLAVLAAVPLVILGGVIASASFRDSGQAALQTARLVHATATARYEVWSVTEAGRNRARQASATPDLLGGVLPSLAVDAGLPVEFGRRHSAVWLINPAGTLVAVSGPAAPSMPSPATLSTLLQANQAAVLRWSAEGRPFAYVTTRWPDGWRLITEYDAFEDFERAANALLIRIGLLALLMLMGLAAVIIGAGITFGEPLRRIATAVEQWHGGGVFEPGPLTGAPREVRELAHSFGLATFALRQREAELVQSQERQNLLVLEIHHRVKNNLQIVASLLNLQASRIRLPAARAEFQAARDRVRALATLHRHLYSDGDLHTINMRSFLVELCGQLFQAMGESIGDPASDRIVLTIEAPELRMSSDHAVPLALIVTEAVTNSVKYAFPDGRHGHISVRVKAAGDQLDLEIDDDGVGIPAGSAQTEAGTRDGIGRQLIRGFARQLGASLAVKEGPGTRYAVRMALEADRPPAASEPLDAA